MSTKQGFRVWNQLSDAERKAIFAQFAPRRVLTSGAPGPHQRRVKIEDIRWEFTDRIDGPARWVGNDFNLYPKQDRYYSTEGRPVAKTNIRSLLSRLRGQVACRTMRVKVIKLSDGTTLRTNKNIEGEWTAHRYSAHGFQIAFYRLARVARA